LDLAKHSVEGYFASEKCDGTRAFWDGGISRGTNTLSVPWANIFHPKTGKLKTNLKPESTGLWSRYGNPIIAPDWWLNQLPATFLDGELFAGRGNFQKCRSIVAGNEPGPDWDQIQFAVYGAPAFNRVFQDGEIKNPNFHRTLVRDEIQSWFASQIPSGKCEDLKYFEDPEYFQDELNFLQANLPGCSDVVYLHRQVQLLCNPVEDLKRLMRSILELGGEGVVLRDPEQKWFPKRMKGLLKCKPTFDGLAKVVGFTSGRKTDKGSKLLGLIGAIITEFEGRRLEIAGLTDAERRFETPAMTSHAAEHPGVDMPEDFQGMEFKVGDTIDFAYRELSDGKVPKDARFKRKG
jgi:DNA ligase-1